MRLLAGHGPRVAATLVPVLLALLHVAGVWRLPLLDRLDAWIYDARVRATMPGTPDPRIVIIDIDDASLQRVGQWPWRRDLLARLATELTGRQRVAALGFDIMFTEPDRKAGEELLRELRTLPAAAADAGLRTEIDRLAAAQDHDTAFARALAGTPAVLGFYFTPADAAPPAGRLPAPVLPPQAGAQEAAAIARWHSFGASIPVLAEAAPAGFLNFFVDEDDDGVVRAVPMLARYAGAGGAAGYYESLGLAVYRRAVQAPAPVLRFASSGAAGARLASLVLAPAAGDALALPVDPSASMLVPYRGAAGPRGGAFRYVSAADVLDGRLAPGELAGRIALVGASAPGLQDLRTTPVGAGYPGVEIHASVVSGLLDRRFLSVPADVRGYEAALVLLLGAGLAVGLTLLPALPAAGLAALAAAAVLGANHLLHLRHGLVMPQAAALAMIALAFTLNMAWGYFVEARARRGLARLFGTYVPPQLVTRMLSNPGRYGMHAESKELTVLFCDMRGFTSMAEHMAPAELQALLNRIFSRLTEVIGRHDGTVDKYMGDCVMAFWGAPVEQPDHAALAVAAALEMAAAVQALDAEHRAAGLPGISVGIGLNTGVMSVGDMGSARRRSYTVIGDAVNLAARLEGLGEHYGVEIVAGERTRELAGAYLWQELDRVKVKGKERGVAIFTPLAPSTAATAPALADELRQWQAVLHAYEARRWSEAEELLRPLRAAHEKKVLYRAYADRLASIRLQPPDTDWDGATRFERK